MHALKCGRSIAVAALLVISAQETLRGAMLTVPVKANITGYVAYQEIGSIVANDRFRGLGGPTTDPSGLTATFTFADKFSFLDKRYDFDWVQIVDAEAGMADFFPRPLPTIDPRPAANPDKYPFYYSKAEWNANSFAGQTLHVDGKTSTFGDVPNQPKDTVFSFSAFLVVRDHGQWLLDGMKKFCVLGGFTWTYAGADGSFDSNRGTSTVGDGIVGPLDPRTIDRINSAIASSAEAANSDPFRTWKNAAMGTCALIPEPSSFALAAMAMLVVGRLQSTSWRRRLSST